MLFFFFYLDKEIKVVLSYEASRSKWRNNQASKEWKQANKVSIAVMGEGLQRKTNCGCIDDLFYMLKTLSKERINQKQTQMSNKFKLIDGKMIHHAGTHYTNANLTDEKAVEILTKFPSHIRTFATYPENWKELTGKPAANVNEDEFNGLIPTGKGDSSNVDAPTGREAELLKMEQPDLLILAKNIAAENDELSNPRHNTGVVKLTAFILENE